MKKRIDFGKFVSMAGLASILVAAPLMSGPRNARSRVGAGASAQKVVPADAGSAAIIATNSAEVKRNAQVAGDVVVNDASPGPYLINQELEIGRSVAVTGSVAANDIKLNQQATVSGDIDCNSGSGVTCSGLTLPVFDPLPPFHESNPNPAAPDVVTGSGDQTIDAGDYGIVDFGSSAQNPATITFSGGLYQMESLVVGNGAILVFQGPTEIRTVGNLDLGRDVTVNSDGSACVGPSSAQVVFYVGGGNFDPNELPAAASAGRDTAGCASIYAQNGTLHLHTGSVWVGGFIGRDVRVDTGASVTNDGDDSAFGNKPPTADPQTLTTNFPETPSPVVITLSGNDPEGIDLDFMIVSGPTEGSLSNLTPVVPALIPEVDDEGVPTGGFIQPPVTSATVDYTGNANNEEDSFVFKVTDNLGAVGMATVTINPFDPTPGVDPTISEVEASDASAETTQAVAIVVALKAAVPLVPKDTEAPGTDCIAEPGKCEVRPVTFTIDAGPSDGVLGSVVSTGLTSATVTYTPDTAPDFTGLDSFTFQAAADLSVPSNGNTTDSGETDIATVNLNVTELAPDQEIITSESVPASIQLGQSTLVGGGAELSIAPTKAVFVAPVEVAGRVGDAEPDGTGDSSDEALLVAAGVGVPTTTTESFDFEQPQFPAPGGVIGVLSGIDFDAQAFSSASSTSGTQSMTGSAGTFSTAVLDFSGLANKPFAFSLVGLDLTVGETIEIVADFTTGPNQTFDVELGGQAAQTPIPFSFSGSDTIESLTLRGTELANRSASRAWLIDDLSIDVGSPVSGTVRLHVEFDVSSLGGSAGSLVGASVAFNTVKGPASSLDTDLFVGTHAPGSQDLVLTSSDFQSPVDLQNSLATMPAGNDPVGTLGTFTVDILQPLRAALLADTPQDVFVIQGRVDEQLSSGEGLQIRSTNPANVTASLVPQFGGATPPPIFIPPNVYTVQSLPTFGTLTDPVTQTLITSAMLPFDLSGNTVTYDPGGTTGSTSFLFQAVDGVTGSIDVGTIFVDVVLGSCLENESFCFDGRP